MKFIILRALQHSELGMFHAYRRSGLEGSRQRAINFDADVVDRVFPTATDLDRIVLRLRYDTDSGSQTIDHSLKRQAKNWRFEGNCPTDEIYDFVEPGCLFALNVDAGVNPATGAWVVFPKSDLTAQNILADGATAGLARGGMIAVELDEAPRIVNLLARARPDLFTAPTTKGEFMATGGPGEGDSAEFGDTPLRLPPGPKRLAAILGSAGHSFVSAVADIIDNSISADATEINITFDPPNSGNGRWLAIRDNGKGMSAEELQEAMRIGGEAEYESRSLGKYGYGLKGASWSQARAFTVVTRQRIDGSLAHLTWDQDNMADWLVDDSPLEDWENEIADPGEHGVTVLWKKMKAPTTAPSAKGVAPHVAEIQELTRHLGLVFHRFLEGNAKGRALLTIRINGILVESNGPVSHPLAQAYDAKTLKMPFEGGAADVRVQPFVLPSEEELKIFHASEGPEGIQKSLDRIGYFGKRNETQGLFIYRNDRLIRWGGWHEMWATNDEKMKLARVIVDFDPALDEAFQINISKQSVRLPGYLQAEIKELANPTRKVSRAKYVTPRSSPRPTPPPRGPAPSPGTPKVPSPPGGPFVPAAPGSTPQPPVNPSSVKIRIVTTNKFAWKIVDGFTGGRTLQISSAIPALAELARFIEDNDDAAASLAAFLEELDEADVQQSLIGADADV